jgi:hypothetical protein
LTYSYLGVEFVKNILEVVSLDGLLRIKQFEELLHKLRRNVNLQGLNVDSFINNELEEELVNSLEVGPRRVYFVFRFNTSLRNPQILFFHTGERPEDVFLDHLHDLVKIGQD